MGERTRGIFSEDTKRSRRSQPSPFVCVPLGGRQDRPLGAIAVFSLLNQKVRLLTALDHELFDMLGGHAATAMFAARLFSQSARKLNTIQGFIDLLDEVRSLRRIPRGTGS